MRRTVSASTSTSVCPPVKRRAAWPVMTTRGISPFPAPATAPDRSRLLRGEARRLLLVERLAQTRRRHRQVAHANADGVGDRIGDRRHPRDDRHLAHALCTKKGDGGWAPP